MQKCSLMFSEIILSSISSAILRQFGDRLNEQIEYIPILSSCVLKSQDSHLEERRYSYKTNEVK